MYKHSQEMKIYLIETIGFALVIAFVWIDELFDLPYNLFGMIQTPVNWIESLFETVVILVMGAIIVFTSRRILNKLKHLEGLLPICSFCKQIRVGTKWIPVEQYIKERSDADFSHSYCPACTQEHYGWIYEEHIGRILT